MEENTSLAIKIIILGSTEVGKTSILDRYFNDVFRQNQVSTIGIDFLTKYFKFDSKKIKVLYNDTAGQEKFRAISINYLKAANGVILVYDITKQHTFDALEGWLKYIKDNNEIDLPKVLIGNKFDLKDERVVSQEEAQKFADSIGCNYYEGSAKTGYNIKEALDDVARITYEFVKDKKNNDDDDDKDGVILDRSKSLNDGKKKKCC